MCLTRARHASNVVGCPVAVVPTTFAQNLAAFADSQGERTNPAERSTIVATSVTVSFVISASLHQPAQFQQGVGWLSMHGLASGHEKAPPLHQTHQRLWGGMERWNTPRIGVNAGVGNLGSSTGARPAGAPWPRRQVRAPAEAIAHNKRANAMKRSSNVICQSTERAKGAAGPTLQSSAGHRRQMTSPFPQLPA